MKYTILVVENNKDTVKKIETAIKSMDFDFNVLVASTISDAYQITESTIIDICLVDIELGNGSKNGWKFVKELKKSYNLTPVIAISDTPDYQRKFLAFNELNLLSFIEMPFKNSQVVEQIKKAISFADVINNRTVTFKRNNFTKTYKVADIYSIHRLPFGRKKVVVAAFDELEGAISTEEFPIESSLGEVINNFDNKNDILRCHQTWFINPKYLHSYNVHTNEITLTNGAKIPVGDTYRKNLKPLI